MSNDTSSNSSNRDSDTFVHDRSLIFKQYAWKDLDKMVRKFRAKMKKFEPDILNWLKDALDPAIKDFIEYIFNHSHIG